jgi:hypothetical protein
MWHVLTTIARQTPRDMFSMWSDPSLLRNNGKATFSMGSVLGQQWKRPAFSLWSVPVMTSCNNGGILDSVFFGVRPQAILGKAVEARKGSDSVVRVSCKCVTED